MAVARFPGRRSPAAGSGLTFGGPAVSYSRDGLAHIAVAEGDRTGAITLFKQSLALDPTNTYAGNALKRLQATPPR